MPRGGRRPGAGAPKGNLNGLRPGSGGKHSPRVQRVVARYDALDLPSRRLLARELYEAGFYPPPAYQFDGRYRDFVRYLHWKWFDSADPAQSNPIKPVQMPPLPDRPRDSRRPPQAPKNPLIEKFLWYMAQSDEAPDESA